MYQGSCGASTHESISMTHSLTATGLHQCDTIRDLSDPPSESGHTGIQCEHHTQGAHQRM